MSKPTIKRAIKTIKEELVWWEEELDQTGQTRRIAETSSTNDV